MKKLMLIIAGGCILYAPSLLAQTPNVSNNSTTQTKNTKRPSPEQRAQRSVEELDKIVGLIAEQKNKVYNLALERAKSVDAVLAKYKGQPDKKEQAKAEIHSIKKNYRQSVKNILTPEQIEKLKQHHQAVHPKPSKNVEDAIPDNHSE